MSSNVRFVDSLKVGAYSDPAGSGGNIDILNNVNNFQVLFAALVKEERKAIKYSINYLRKILSLNELKIIESFAFGTTVPNKTPIVILPILKFFDIKYPFGMTNILITEKNS